MRRRHPLPRLWLMTDERQGDALLPAVRRLPRGSGIVFRHYSLAGSQRLALFRKVKRLARSRGLMLFLAGPEREARVLGADGSHGCARRRLPLPASASVHDLAEIRAAEKAGADFLFLSPLASTRSHPGAEPLGLRRFHRLAAATRLPVIALGGIDHRRARFLRCHGWSAIDGLAPPRQKRNAVPT